MEMKSNSFYIAKASSIFFLPPLVLIHSLHILIISFPNIWKKNNIVTQDRILGGSKIYF